MIEITSKQIDRVNLLLSSVKGGADRVITGAVKKGQQAARSETKKGIKEIYDIRPGVLNKNSKINIRTRKADGGIIGEVSFSGYKIPLFKFRATPKKSGTRKLVKARQMKANAMTPFAHAFIATMPKNGHTGIFERDGEKRLHITEKKGSSVGQMASNAIVVERVEKKAQEVIDNHIEENINKILNRAWG